MVRRKDWKIGDVFEDYKGNSIRNDEGDSEGTSKRTIEEHVEK